VIIDDEAPIRKVLQMLFRERYEVQAFESSEAFRDQFALGRPYVLVVDKNLPGISGLELIRVLREEGHDFEAVLITAYADMDSAIRAVELGIYSYLRKPFETEALISTVAGAHERLSLRLQLRETNEALERQNVELGEALEKLRVSETARAISERLAALGQVSASVAHELNNALSYVVNNVSIVEMAIPGLKAMRRELEAKEAWRDLAASRSLSMFDELEETVSDMRAGLQVIERLSADMSTLARPGREASVFDLREAVRLGVRMASARLRNTARPAVELPEAEVPIHGRHHRLVQVLMNLLVNAADAIQSTGRPNGQVKVSLTTDGAQAILEVADDGCGIAPDRLEQICQPFVTFTEHGTGVGLALVSSIVEEHHGEIAFDSEVDRGTTVTVRLPLADA